MGWMHVDPPSDGHKPDPVRRCSIDEFKSRNQEIGTDLAEIRESMQIERNAGPLWELCGRTNEFNVAAVEHADHEEIFAEVGRGYYAGFKKFILPNTMKTEEIELLRSLYRNAEFRICPFNDSTRPDPKIDISPAHWKATFLDLYRKLKSFEGACRVLGVSQQTVDKWRGADEAFNDAFMQIPDQIREELESRLFGYIENGVEKEVWFMGEMVGRSRNQDPNLLLTALKARDRKYRVSESQSTHLNLTAEDLENMTDEELDKLSRGIGKKPSTRKRVPELKGDSREYMDIEAERVE